MNTPTFKEQFDKITRAYFENKLQPRDCAACFVGNLLNGTTQWSYGRRFESMNEEEYDMTTGVPRKSELALQVITEQSGGLYTIIEIVDLEKNFLIIWINGHKTEDSLFAAIDSTLDMLRKIHESKGQIIEDFEFNKRQVPVQ